MHRHQVLGPPESANCRRALDQPRIEIMITYQHAGHCLTGRSQKDYGTNCSILGCLQRQDSWARRQNARLITYVLAGMATFCIIASGNWLHVLGHRLIPMPDIVLSHLPFFRNVRASSRAIVFVYMFLAIGIGEASALARGHWTRPIVRWAIIGVAALMVVDFFPAHRLPMTPISCSTGLVAVRDDPEPGFGVLDLPAHGQGYYDIEGNFYMLQQAACHSRPIVQGNTSRKVVVSLQDRLSPDLEIQHRQLMAAKVKYIIIHKNNDDRLFHWGPENAPQSEYRLKYSMIYDGSDAMVLKVY
jgi:hypothetical protein